MISEGAITSLKFTFSICWYFIPLGKNIALFQLSLPHYGSQTIMLLYVDVMLEFKIINYLNVVDVCMFNLNLVNLKYNININALT